MTQSSKLVAVLLALVLVLGAAASGLTAKDRGMNKHVRKRIELMTTQKNAMTILADMMAGRMAFDSGQARAARRSLVRTTGSIEKRFRKQHMDPASNARVQIWLRWDDFEHRAGMARAAARDLNTSSLNGLRRTLPPLLRSCLSCHESYRSTPNEFTTH